MEPHEEAFDYFYFRKGLDAYLDEFERVKNATHRLIRRQATWFKAADARIAWSSDAASLAARPLEALRA